MGRRKKDQPEMSFYERRAQVLTPSGTAHQVFLNVADHQKVTDKTEKGIRVLVARYPDFYKIYFHSYLPVGSDSYPRGGVRVFNATVDQYQCFYFESVALHPKGGKYSFEYGME
jgi:hypothetical protein